MPRPTSRPIVSVVVLHSTAPPPGRSPSKAFIESALEQDHDSLELIIVEMSDEPCSGLERSTDEANDRRIHRIRGSFPNRSAALNAALADARGDWVLLLQPFAAGVRLKRSAVTAFVTVGNRHSNASMVYSDYQRINADGRDSEIHLSAFHPGRLRETTDFGPVVLCRADALRSIGGFDETCDVAEQYDLRLRLSQHGELVHIANRRGGSLYTVSGSASAHSVFDYLLDDDDTRRELERALTNHLRSVGGYLAPGANVGPVPHSRGDSYALKASVIVPVNRRPEFIGRAIESVQAQTVPEVETIVVVNGGTDDPTIGAVRRYLPGGDLHDPRKPAVHLIVVDINNIGLSISVGLTAARGRYYVQLDSDDRLKPCAVERILAVFDSDPTVGMVIGSYEVWDLDESTGQISRNQAIPTVTHDEWTADNGRNNLLRVNGAGAPRAAPIEVIREVGGFGCNDTPFSSNYGEDYDLVLRISERYTIGRVWEPIYEVVRHRGGTDHSIDQVTATRNNNAKDEMRRAAIDRRREINLRLRSPDRV